MCEIPIYHEDSKSVYCYWVLSIRFLICKYQREFDNCKTLDERMKQIEILWEREFSAQLIKVNQKYSKIKFENQDQKMLFLLRFFR